MATLSRVTFRKLAAALASTRPPLDASPATHHQWRIDRQAVINICAESNPRFDHNLFITATEQPTQ